MKTTNFFCPAWLCSPRFACLLIMMTTGFFYARAQAPANDECDFAVQIFCGEIVSGSTVFATVDNTPDCGTTNTAPGVWYSFIGTGDNITVSTCDNADYDTKITVYTDGCGFFTCVAGNDDALGCPGNTSEVTFPSSLGNQYLILVHGFDGEAGGFSLTLTCTVAGGNDDCSGAIPIACGESVNGSTLGASVDAVPDCDGLSASAGGVWYSITGTGEQFELSTCNTASYDTRISVYTGGCGALTCVTANDDGAGCAGFTSRVTFVSDLGTEYLILVHGFQVETGDFSLSASCSTPVPAPPNDNCADVTPTAITNGTPVAFTGTTLGATQDAGEAAEFGFNVVWEAFSVSGTCNNVEIAYCGSTSPTFNIFASLYLGCLPGGTFVSDDNGVPDDLICGDGNVVYTFSNLPAGTYYIPVFADASFLDPLGDYTVTVSSVDCPPPSPNDLCSQAIAIGCGDVVSGNTVGTTVDAVNACDGTPVEAPGVWYSILGTGDFFTLSTCGTSNYDTKLTVYTDGCGVLSCVAENDDGVGCAGFTSTVGFLSTPGQEYLLLVHGFDAAAAGLFDLSVTCTQNLLPNEVCANVVPTVIASGASETFNGTTAGSVNDPADNAEFGAKVVWEAFTVTGDCNMIEVAYCGSVSATFNIFARLYLGCPPGNNFVEDDDGTPDDAICGDGNLVYTYSFLPAGTYYIPVFADEVALDSLGPYTVTVSVEDCPPVAANDLCEDAIAIACGDTVSGNTFGATADNAPTCVATVTSPGIWYSFTGTGDFVQLSTCGTAGFDTKINVYTGDCDSLVCVTGNDDAAGCTGFTSIANFASQAGVEYLILVHGFLQEVGVFDMSVTCTPITVANDACFGAFPVSCGQTVSGSTTDATPDGLPTCGTTNTAPGVWYVFTGDGSVVNATLCNAGTNYDTKISVFKGSCGALECVGGNDDDGSCLINQFFSTTTFLTEAGVNYYMVVHGFGANEGSFELSISCTAPLANDNCSDITPAAVANDGTPTVFNGTTDGASQDAFEVAEFGFNIVWEAFTLTGDCNKNVTISYCGSQSPTFNIFARLYTACQSNSFIEDSDGLPDDVACGDGNLTYNFDNVPAGTYYIPVFADAAFLDPLGPYTVTVTAVDVVVTSFTLVNADTDQDIGPLNDGDILNLRDLPNIAIRANTCGTLGSVLFTLNGTPARTENIAPYALTGDVPTGNYRPWNPVVGDYELTADGYNGANGSGGLAGLGATINFTVIDDDCKFLVIDLLTDNFGEETGGTLVDLNDGTILGTIEEGTLDDNTSYRFVFCVDPSHCYELTITDAFGDGICCFQGLGSYTVTFDGAVVATGGAFEDVATATVGTCVEDCEGVIGGTAVTDVNGDCCQPEDLDCAGVCFGTDNSPQVTSFTLIGAADDSNLGELVDGAVIDLSVTGPINIQANVCPEGSIESVQFLVNGAPYRMENIPFYTIGGDDNGNYHAWNVTPGTYTIRATPYGGNNGTGGAGTFLEITITITDGTLPCTSTDRRVTSFTLVNAATEADLGTLLNGAVIDLSVTPSINIRANVCDEANIESVRFHVNGSSYVMENIPFYTIAGDNAGNYTAWNVQPGTYTVRATPYAGNNGTGTVGTFLEVTFTVVAGGLKTSGPEQQVVAAPEELMLLASPNPFKDQLNFEFSVHADSRVQLEMFSVSGARIATLFEGDALGGQVFKVTFSAGELASGMYYYRMTTNDSVITDKVLLSR